MFNRLVTSLLLTFIVMFLTINLPTVSVAAGSGPRIAVIPISENAPPSLKAAQVAASHVETLLNRQGRLNVVDSASVATAVRVVEEQSGAPEINWRAIAENLDLDLVALLSVVDAHVDYLGSQIDHLAIGEGSDEPGQRHIYEGKAIIRLTVVDVEKGTTLLDEEAKGKKSEGYRQSHDASKYAEIVTTVRDIVSIFDDSVKTNSGTTLTEDYAQLAMTALEKATKELDDPLKEAFPLRGTIILIEDRKLTVDLGSTSGIKKGMKFEVVRPGKVIVHPTTGENISTGDEGIGSAKVKSVSNTTSVLEADRKAASEVKIGDSVVEKM